MGLFGKIGGMLGIGGGKKKDVGYASKDVPEYEGKLKEKVYGRLEGKGPTVAEAKKGYSFGGIDEAMGKAREPSKLKETYKSSYSPSSYSSSYAPKAYGKTSFDFKSLPQEYTDRAYQSGAKSIQRRGADELTMLKEAAGTRRPGKLLKAGLAKDRDVGERLAGLRSDLEQQKVAKETELAVNEQVQQAAENYRAAGFSDDQARRMADEKRSDFEAAEDIKRFDVGEKGKEFASRSDLEKAKAAEDMDKLRLFSGMAGEKLGRETDITGRERDYQDRAIDMLSSLFGTTASLKSGAAQAGAQQKSSGIGQTFGFLRDLL